LNRGSIRGSMKGMKKTTVEIAQFGRRLGTRREGAAAHRVLVAALDALPPDGQLVLSLAGLDVLSGSFADEAIGKLCQLLSSGLHGDRSVVLSSPSADLVEDLNDKLAQRKLAMLCRVGGADGAWLVLGQPARPLIDTLELLNDRKSATTKELADLLGIPANVCHNRVRRLVRLHLVREERIDTAAPNTQYRFHAILG
jgi:hypothetical protein